VWRRAEAFLAENMVGPSVVEWLSRMMSELRAVLIERVIRIAAAELAEVGRTDLGIAHCWLLFGGAGRREMMTSVVPNIGVMYDDPPPGVEAVIEKYFSTLAQKVAVKLEACGLQITRAPAEMKQCRALSAWEEFYRSRIRDPLGSQIYTSREHFDFDVVSGDPGLGARLQGLIAEELKGGEMFIPILANDTFANLPPLTFYQGFVLDTDGKLNRTLDVERTALIPITDAARVLAFATRDVSTANTLGRLQRSARALPQYASILSDAAEAWRIICYHHTLAAMSKPGENAVIFPPRLSRFEQRLLKTAFDSTRRLIELVSSIYSLGGAP
jgi:CBS domain-containing protein